MNNWDEENIMMHGCNERNLCTSE